jgi:hypothetical protein
MPNQKKPIGLFSDTPLVIANVIGTRELGAVASSESTVLYPLSRPASIVLLHRRGMRAFNRR